VFPVFLLIFLSRLFFLSISPSFYDSVEYLRLFESLSLLDSLKEAHLPIHPIFIALGWLFNRINLGGVLFTTEVLNSILGLLFLIFFFLFLSQITERKKALTLTAILAFIPPFWLSQINVLYEPLLGLFLMASFYFIFRYQQTLKLSFLHLAALFFSLSFLVSLTALPYLIFFGGFAAFFLNKKIFKVAFLFFVYLLPSFLIYGFILKLKGLPINEGLAFLFLSNNILEKISQEGWLFFLRGFRNSWLIFSSFLTFPLSILTIFLALKQFFSANNQTRAIIIFWGICFFLLNSYWHAGMFGRLSLFLIIPPLILLLKIKSSRFLFLILTFIIFVSFLQIFPYRLKKVPNFQEREYFKENYYSNPLMIISNYEEPYLIEYGEALILNSPKTDLSEYSKRIKEALLKGRLVFITSQAISTPYFQFDGMKYHILSRRKNHPETQGEKLIKNCQLLAVKEWKNFNLKVYRILSCPED